MKQAFAQARNEREENFRTLKSTVDQTEESVNSLRQELVSMREDVQKLEATLGERLNLLNEAVQRARAEQATPQDIEAAVDKAVASAVKEIGKVMEPESEEQARLEEVMGANHAEAMAKIEGYGDKLEAAIMKGVQAIQAQLQATAVLLKEFEIKRELEYIEEPPLGSGAFGFIQRARSVICLYIATLPQRDFTRGLIHSTPRYDGNDVVVKKIATTGMDEAKRQEVKKEFIHEASTTKDLR